MDDGSGGRRTPQEALERLRTRALTAFPFPQTLDSTVAMQELHQLGEHAQAFVWERDDGTHALVHLWSIKADRSFHRSFTCYDSYFALPPHLRGTFKLQAIEEFRRAIRAMGFGNLPAILDEIPIQLATSTRTNTLPVYVGDADELERYLRLHPGVVDGLRIKRLYPGGFLAVVGEKQKGGKAFNFTRGSVALYTKQGGDKMACIKPLSLFNVECKLIKESHTEHAQQTYSA